MSFRWGQKPHAATAALVVALSMLTFPLAAEGKVHLDSTFGRGGKVTVSSVQAQESSGARVAEGPDGRLVLGVGSSVRRYLVNGSLDRDFGSNGQITVAPPGGAPFSLSGLAVDTQGRVLIAGTTLRPAKEPQADHLPVPSGGRATLFRYLSDGTPDPSFDGDGFLETDFGLNAPVDPSGRQFEEPVTRLTDVAIDSQGRIAVLFRALVGYRNCGGEVRSYPNLTDRSYVARLTEGGTLDPSFGEGGRASTSVDVGVQGVMGWIDTNSEDQPLFLSVGGYCTFAPTALGKLDQEGNLDTSFGGGGWRRIPNRNVADIAM